MNATSNSAAGWGFATWFVLFSPVIGILLGLFAAFLVLH